MKRLLPILLLVACTTAEIDLPPDTWSVEGANPRRWNQPLSFGPYRTTYVNEGTTRSWLADLGVAQIGKADQGYRLTVNGVAVECHTREVVIGRDGFFADAAFGREPLLFCGYDRGGARSVLALSRTGSAEPSLAGELREANGGARYEVRSLHRHAHGSILSAEPFGYAILRDGRRVAAVETINRGRVWIDADAGDRDVLAAAAASLLLFRDPDAGS